MFVGGESVYFFETEDKIVKLISNVLNYQVPCAYAYGERSIYYLSDQFIFIPYKSIINEKRISEMDVMCDTFNFLYNTSEGERIKLKSLSLIATRFNDDSFEEYFNYMMTGIIEDEEDEIEIIYNGTNEIVKIFNQKCVICLDNDSIYAFRNCGHLCLCENCFDPKITKCVVCRCT